MPGQRVLIIEENPRQRMALNDALENLGFRVDVSPDGLKARQLSDATPYNLIIADFDTPNFLAIDFLKQVKKKYIDSQVLFVSDHPQIEDAVEAMKAGAFDFMIKPMEKEQLELVVKRIFLDKKRVDRTRVRKSGKDKPVTIITEDSEMQRLLKLVQRVADSSASVLIQGESGTGKELFAKFIHQKSTRNQKPFVAVNCAALPESLLESELFGHEKGAFTGAIARKLGKFELAHQGTIFLDEITEMQFHLQAKLLRVLQEKQIDRVGGTDPVEVDVRVIATTNRDVKESIEQNQFREDLYYRLSTIPIVIPPLRDRHGDVALLAGYFIKKYSKVDARNVKGLTTRAHDLLGSQTFSGNVRELENIIHRAVLLAEKERIEPCDLMIDGPGPSGEAGQGPAGHQHQAGMVPLKEMEERAIFQTLDKTDGNRTHAAKILGISVRTLRNKLNEYKKAEKS